MTLKITRIDRAQARAMQQDPLRHNYFDGEVHLQEVVGLADSQEVELLAVYFSPGARTRPHIHQHDQILQILEGRCIVATETEKHILAPGDVITIPGGIWHWHGATRDTATCHLSIKMQGPTNWEVEEKNWISAYE
jgi:quercetin dioxygenase-like cupin family protein